MIFLSTFLLILSMLFNIFFYQTQLTSVFGGMIAQHMDYFISSHFTTLVFIGFVSLYFVVGRIPAFRTLSLMLCGNKIRLSFLV